MREAPTEKPGERVRELYSRGEYEAALSLAATLGDEELFDAPCEALADRLRKRRPAGARRLYEAAIEMWYREGALATGSGEGLVVVHNVERIRKKIEKLRPRRTGMSRVLERSEWDQYICDHLAPAVKLLGERYGLRVAEVHLDMKAVMADAYLDGDLPPGAAAALQAELPRDPDVRVGEHSISCSRDYCALVSASRKGAPPDWQRKSLLARLKELFR